jgi:deoxyribose-phosphate aldolase
MDVSRLTEKLLADTIDYAYFKPNGTRRDIEQHCLEAIKYKFAMVAINPAEIETCVELLRGSQVRVGAAIGFPLGQTTLAVKLYEIQDAIQRGALEMDMVINVRAVIAGNLDLVHNEIGGAVKLCQPLGVTTKIILETYYLTDDEKRTVCRIALEENADFVKTTTGAGPGGATVEDVKLMRQEVGRSMGVKAAGGIRNLDSALAMLAAGANRLGTSSGAKIMQEFLAKKEAVPALTKKENYLP